MIFVVSSQYYDLCKCWRILYYEVLGCFLKNYVFKILHVMLFFSTRNSTQHKVFVI
jgi:hypothetical protein